MIGKRKIGQLQSDGFLYFLFLKGGQEGLGVPGFGGTRVWGHPGLGGALLGQIATVLGKGVSNESFLKLF